MNVKRIGITGATGFIGRNLISRLLSDKFQVSVFCLDKRVHFPKNVKVFKGDLVKSIGIKDFVNGLDVVVHLAGRVLPPEEKIFEENILSTYNLLQSVKKPTKIIFNSSAAVYGSQGGKLKEEDNCRPDTTYGLSKQICEEMVKYYLSKFGGKYIILRPFNIYGPGNFKGVVFNFYKSIKERKKVVITGNGKQRRNFLYIDDEIDAIITSIGTDASGTFNLATKRNYSIESLANMFKKIMKTSFRVEYVKDDREKTGTINIDSSLASKKLGWKPDTDLLKGLRKTIEWYEKDTSYNTL